jgi:hypothetical protein
MFFIVENELYFYLKKLIFLKKVWVELQIFFYLDVHHGVQKPSTA